MTIVTRRKRSVCPLMDIGARALACGRRLCWHVGSDVAWA